MSDNRRCYVDEILTLLATAAPKEEIFGRMQELTDLISEKLAVVADAIHPNDYPFVVACMEMSCENMRALFSPGELQLVENLKAVIQRRDRMEAEE